VVVARSSGAGARCERKAGSGPRPALPSRLSRPASVNRGTRTSSDRQRQKVEDLAEEIFARRGYRGATMREVATRAGCSVGQLYKLYPNKLELYRSVIDAKAELVTDMVRQTFDSSASPEERLRRMVHQLLGFFQEHVIFFRILALETGPSFVRGNRHFLDRVDRWRVDILDRTTEVIRAGQQDGSLRPEPTAQLAAISFFGLLKGHTGEWILQMDGLLVDRADAILDLFFVGMQRRTR
jgi:AcrR family transcriptional regulator